MPQTTAPGIFCLESDWNEDLADRWTVQPVLDLLAYAQKAKHIRRDCGTRQEFEYYLRQWASNVRYADYPVLYIAAHGGRKNLAFGFGEGGEVELTELAELLRDQCQGRVIYFGSCLVFDCPEYDLKSFARKTKARAIVGYKKEIDWFDSACFETVLLSGLLDRRRTDGFFNELDQRYGRTVKELGLVAATSSNVYMSRRRRSKPKRGAAAA